MGAGKASRGGGRGEGVGWGEGGGGRGGGRGGGNTWYLIQIYFIYLQIT